MDNAFVACSIPLVYSTCPRYRPLSKGFFFFWKRFFPAHSGPIYTTDSKVCIDIADRLVWRLPDKYENKSFSTRLLKTICAMNEEFILFALDDFWLNKPVNISLLQKAYACIRNDSSIAFINLNEASAEVSGCGCSSFSLVAKKDLYRVSTQIGIWRVSCLRRVLRVGESAWAFEHYGTERSSFMRCHYLRLAPHEQPAFSYPTGGVLCRGAIRPTKEVMAQIEQLGIQEIRVFDYVPLPAKKLSRLLRLWRAIYRTFYRAVSPFLPIPYLLR